jgi:response regulator of citrate/malate metabolism
MIKVLLISIDQKIKSFVTNSYNNSNYQFITFNSTKDPLDIMSQICSFNPSILILDDDFVSPISVHLLSSLKKVNPKLSVIFLTSNTSLELGRNINSIGVKHYLIKPISEIEFKEYLNSLFKAKENINYYPIN